MSNLATRVDIEFAKNIGASPGDIVRFHRSLGYSHSALYVGEGYIIHIADPNNGTCKTGKTVVVRKDPICKVVNGDDCTVENLIGYAYNLGLAGRPAADIIRHAEQLVGSSFTYSLGAKNCDHFVTMLKYYIAFSDQAENASQNSNAVWIGMGGGMVAGATTGAAIGSIGGPPGAVAGGLIGFFWGTAGTLIGVAYTRKLERKALVARKNNIKEAWKKVEEEDRKKFNSCQNCGHMS